MQHDRRLSGIVIADKFGAQTLRHREVDLHRAALPGATDRILDVKFDFRAVEGAFARQFSPTPARKP